MEKAFELKSLLDGLKLDGLEVGEDAAKKVIARVLDWVEASVKLSENKIDDLAIALIPLVRSELLKLAEKISDAPQV